MKFSHKILLALLLGGLWPVGSSDAQEKQPAGDEEKAEQPQPAKRILGRTSIDWKKSLQEAYAEARAAGKYVMIDFEAEWCSWCKKLDRETYTKESVIRFVTEHFVSVKVDVDKQQGVVPRYRVGPLPTILFVDVTKGGGATHADHDGHADHEGHEHEGEKPAKETEKEASVDLDFFREVGRIEGFRAAAVFIEEAQKFVDSGKALAQLEKEAGEHPKDATAQRAYARALFADGRLDSAEGLLERAIERIPEGEGLELDLAEVLRAKSEHARAVELYRKALDAPKTAVARRRQIFVALASSLVSLEKPRDAETVLSEFLGGVEEKIAKAQQARPPVQLEPGQDPKKAVQEARRVSGEELEALFLRGYVRAVQGNPGGALADLKIAERADPLGEWGFRAGFIIQRLAR